MLANLSVYLINNNYRRNILSHTVFVHKVMKILKKALFLQKNTYLKIVDGYCL